MMFADDRDDHTFLTSQHRQCNVEIRSCHTAAKEALKSLKHIHQGNFDLFDPLKVGYLHPEQVAYIK